MKCNLWIFALLQQAWPFEWSLLRSDWFGLTMRNLLIHKVYLLPPPKHLHPSLSLCSGPLCLLMDNRRIPWVPSHPMQNVMGWSVCVSSFLRLFFSMLSLLYYIGLAANCRLGFLRCYRQLFTVTRRQASTSQCHSPNVSKVYSLYLPVTSSLPTRLGHRLKIGRMKSSCGFHF